MKYHAPVLLAEDDENEVLLLQHAFRKCGFPRHLITVPNGREAIRYLKGDGLYADRRRFPWPSLFLLDLKMPDLDGFDVLKWIRRNHKLSPIRIAVLSSSKYEPDIQRALDLGAHFYWVKPRDFNDLMGNIREVCRQIMATHGHQAESMGHGEGRRSKPRTDTAQPALRTRTVKKASPSRVVARA